MGAIPLIDKLKNLRHTLKVTYQDPSFFQRIFTLVSRLRKGDRFSSTYWDKICSEEYDDLSRRLDLTEIQASPSVRNVMKTRRIAVLLFSDKGELDLEGLAALLPVLQQSLYFLGPDRQYDSVRQEHLLRALTALQGSKEIRRLFKNVGKPYANRFAEDVIRDTLGLPPNTMITDADAKRAVLSAWLCYLRQNVGSCFATAPAIIIHDEQPEQMLADMNELLATGRLKRTFGGVEYSVPISGSWGAGDLKRPIVLPLGPAFESSHLHVSPGLLQAFESVGLIAAEESLKIRIEKNKSLLLTILGEWGNQGHYAFTSAEEIIKKVLLKDLQLTEEDLFHYDHRPKNLLQSNLMMQTATLGGGKGQACANFYLRFEIAKNGFKSIADNALLKTWEFTLASFAETKADFTRWNLYSSLGLGAQEEGGIGQSLYAILTRKVEEANQKIQEFQAEYEMAYQSIKYLEGRIRSASSEKEAAWTKAEYQSKRNEFDMLEEMRDRYHRRAQRFSSLFDFLMNTYDDLFPRYFQEVYDADMHEVSAGPYDDSPAGFRLLYKHGRSNTSQWSLITSPAEFIEALSSFFSNTESEISASPELAGLEHDVTEIVTTLVAKIRSDEFLETAFYRMARAHQTPMIKNPLENLDKIEKKPWAYTSGGTMGTLVSCYYKLENKPTEKGRWVENPTELLVFLIDTVKQIPHKLLESYEKDSSKSLLIHSPTHAFLLKPSKGLFQQAIQNDTFTYTYVRDQFILPSERFVRKIDLEEGMQEHLIDKIAEKVAPDFRHYFKQVFSYIAGRKDPVEFRQMIFNTVSKERGLRFGRGIIHWEEIDGLLFSLLPLFPMNEWEERVREILEKIPSLTPLQKSEMLLHLDELSPSFQTGEWGNAKLLQDAVKALICLITRQTSSPIDYHQLVSNAAKELGYSMPMPIIFADTNWIRDEFGFVFSPGTGRFELWRLDCTGNVGAPLSSWEPWLNGTERTKTWGVYIRPYEYR